MLKKQHIFFFVFALNALLYSLVYFFPLSEYGEPQIPVVFKLIFDVFLLATLIPFGIKRNLDEVQISGLLFFLIVLFVGLIHIHHTSMKDYLHFSIRNICFYGLFLFVDFFLKINKKDFRRFHEGLFKLILFFGIILFLLQKAGVPNPFSFGEWMWERNRLIVSWLNPNSLGFYLIFYLFYYYSKHGKIVPYMGLIALSIFLTGSLTAIIGTVFFVLYLFVKFISSKTIKPTYVLAILVLTPVLVYAMVYFGVLDYILFKIDVLFVKKDKIYTSVSTRVQNINDLFEYFRIDNLPSILLGDFHTESYRRLDSQYLNIFYNYGLLGLGSYFIFLLAILFKVTRNINNEYSKTFIFFSLWLYLIAFNLTAYLYRSNVVVFYYVMLIFTLSNQKAIRISDSRPANPSNL